MNPSLAESFTKAIDPLLEKIIQLKHSQELAWGLIANAYGGDWGQASLDWSMAAGRWCDAYFSRPYIEKAEKAFRKAGLTKLSEPVDFEGYVFSCFCGKEDLWAGKSFNEIISCTDNFDTEWFDPTVSAVIQAVKETDNGEYHFVNVVCFNGVIALTSSRGTDTWDGTFRK